MGGMNRVSRIADGALQVDSPRPAFHLVAVVRFCLERRLSMFRVPMITLLLTAALAASTGLAGCADDSSVHHGGPPPQDPADYHGVPTDTRPPVMVPTAP